MEPTPPHRAHPATAHLPEAPALLDALPHRVAVLDCAGRISYANAAWRRSPPRLPDGNGDTADVLAAVERRAGETGAPESSTGPERLRALREGRCDHFEGSVAISDPGSVETVRIDRVSDGSGGLIVTLDPRPLAPPRTSLDPGEPDYHALYEESPIGFFSCRPDGRYLAANPAFLKMLGYESVQALQDRAAPLSSGSESTPILGPNSFRRGSADEVLGDREIEFVDVNGRPVQMRLWLRPVLAEDGDLERIEGAAEDITDRRALERRLLEAQRIEAIGQLAGGVAHDFNNILTVVLASAQMGLQEVANGSDAEEHLNDIQAAARSGSLVTRQLLMFARRDRNNPVVLDVGAAIQRVQRLVSRLIGERIAVVLDLEHESLGVVMDPGRFDQVIMNLAVNARDAMPEGGTLTISTRLLDAPSSRVEISVRDTGSGMTEEVRSQALDPFFTTKARGEGTGLGLASVHGIVHDAGGEIEIDSAPGSGTTVRIRLPLSPSGQPEHHEHADGFAGTARVLLVEDSDEVRRAVRMLLESAGLSVVDAADGASALACLRSSGADIDLVLIDVVLPDLSVDELVESIRTGHPDLPVIFTSGYPDPESEAVERESRSGAVLLPKPFSIEQLAEAVVEALSGNRTTRTQGYRPAVDNP